MSASNPCRVGDLARITVGPDRDKYVTVERSARQPDSAIYISGPWWWVTTDGRWETRTAVGFMSSVFMFPDKHLEPVRPTHEELIPEEQDVFV